VAGYAVQWRLPQGRLAAKPFRLPGGAGTLFYRSQGRQLVSVGDSETAVVDARSGRPLRTYKVGGGAAALSPDGRTVVLGDDQGTVRFLNVPSGAITTAVAAHAGAVTEAGITPDGKSAVTSGDDGKSVVWDLATHQVRTSLVGHAGTIHGQAISPDGSTLYTGSFDTTILASDLNGQRGFVRTFVGARSNPALMAWNVAISPNGRVVAVGGIDGRVNLWDTRSLRRLASFQAVPGFVVAVSFGAGGRTLLVAGDRLGQKPRGWLRIWRLGPKPAIAHELTGGPPLYTWATFSPDGRYVAAVGSTPAGLSAPYKVDGLVTEWSGSGRLLSPTMRLTGGGLAIDASFAGHGPRVAVTELDNRVAVVDPTHHAIVARWRASHTLQADGAALSPGGQRVATVDFDGFLREWRAVNGRSILAPIRASESSAWSVDWSPDGSRLLTAGSDGTVRIYDARTGQQVGASLPMPGEQQVTDPYATYSQDGKTIAATDATGRIWLYRAGLGGWEAYACQLAGRNLTRAEWAKFVPGQPYQRICPAGG
jgi:WD40 repeat protein